jgi:hypothetical protein
VVMHCIDESGSESVSIQVIRLLNSSEQDGIDHCWY